MQVKMSTKLKHAIRIVSVALLLANVNFLSAGAISAQSELESNNYKILDPTTDSGGGATDSTNYSLLSSTGNPTADARLESGNYAIGSGFPNGIQANVPLIRCAETTTTAATPSLCLHFPNADGAQGECGVPGCYDRAKIEIDAQDNPIDTLYLIEITNTDTTQVYYVQSDNTVATTYDIGDYMTICQFEGRDPSDPDCDNNSDPNWDETLQSTNVYGLMAGANFSVRVRALHGDFTESQYSPAVAFSTTVPSLGMDLDIGTTSAAETASPYSIDLGELSVASPTTASDLIWLDLNTNSFNGLNAYVKSANAALDGGVPQIPSQAEDLATDTDGGYGLKISSYTQSSLGPIQASNFETAGADEVGNLTLSNKQIFFTDTSGANRGPVTLGRAGIYVKARTAPTVGTGVFSDTITFYMIANF